MSRFLSPRYQALSPYTPGEQPQDRSFIKLNTNESPFPPSPAVIEAISAVEVSRLRLYSDPDCRVLRRKLADRYGVAPENVYLSNGSDDILNFAFMAYASDGRKACYPDVTYGFYRVYAALMGTDAAEIPLKKDFSVDIRDYEGREGMIVLANPNAPTGIALPLCRRRMFLMRAH